MKNNQNENYDVPVLLSAKDLVKLGVTRYMAYCILNREDVPVIKIGDRKLIKRDDFFAWLESCKVKKQKAAKELTPEAAEETDTANGKPV